MFLGDKNAYSTAHYIRYFIEKPYETNHEYDYDMIGLYDKWVNIASKTSRRLVVQTPNGESIFFPKDIKKHQKPYKKVMNIPTNPMKLYSLKIPHSPLSDDERWEG